MKVIQKRIYTALPRVSSPTVSSPNRVRSNSLYTSNNLLPLSFFDSPPPPPSARPVLSTTRLPIEAKTQSETGTHHSHPSLALTAPTNNTSTLALSVSPAQCALFPYPQFSPAPRHSASAAAHDPQSVGKRNRKRYQLDVAAYGIPKRCKATTRDAAARLMHTRAYDDSNLAVQVGEDAYFIRNNAMGVADGVGGWARSKHADKCQVATSSSPSALFARRLMHYCSAELESETVTPLPSTSASFFATPFPPRKTPTKPKLHRSSPSPLLSPSDPWYWADPSPSTAQLEADLEDSLEDLEEGIDVLTILERAYEQTVKAHVVSAPAPSTTDSPAPPLPIPSVSFSSTAPVAGVQSETSTPHTIPLLSGSSTALIAVLDHIPRTLSGTSGASQEGAYAGYDAVIKIAHIGDCMGMLVRGEEITWRSEEMWWNFNTPVQLSPPNPASSRNVTPSNAAHIFTLPVLADDILILASDGLSDNLWDEDVLDEVVRFRRSFLGPASTSTPQDDVDRGATATADRLLRRRTLAGMLSEALCSRARRVSERRKHPATASNSGDSSLSPVEEDEVPFARRAREVGKSFSGGKSDDISVIVAVIAPAGELATQ